MRGQARRARTPPRPGQEPPFVDVLDDVLMVGQPSTGLTDLVGQDAVEQHCAGIDGMPTGARERHHLAHHIAGLRGQRYPVEASAGQPLEPLPSTHEVAAHNRSAYGQPEGSHSHNSGMPQHNLPADLGWIVTAVRRTIGETDHRQERS